MRIKELFTVPDGKKVTEKAFGRVLVSSICSILLCMACLAGTTWAWFTVSIENTGNVIQIATVTADISITDGVTSTIAESPDNHYTLESGTYAIAVKVQNDATNSTHPVYVLMSIASGEEPDYYYFTFEPNSSEPQRIELCFSDSVTVSFSVSWVKPVSAEPFGNETVISDATEPATEPSTEIGTAATEPSTEATTIPTTEDATTPTTEPVTEPSTEETTIPTTEATEAATEAATIPTTTGETTEPTPATEETTIPATDATTAPTTAPTSIPTEPVTEPDGTTSPTETD